MANQLASDRITTGLGRLAYPAVFKPRPNKLKNDELAYSCIFLIPKTADERIKDPNGLRSNIQNAITALLKEQFGKIEPKHGIPLKDGDKELNTQGEPKFPGFWFIKAATRFNAEYPLTVIDGKKNPITGGWKSGDYGQLRLNLKAYDQTGNKGVSAYLEGVQFVYEGEAIGQVYDPAQGFDEFADSDTGSATTSGFTTDHEDFDPFALD